MGTEISAKISKNTWESRAGFKILTISAVKATGCGDRVLKKMLAPNDGCFILKLNVGKEQNIMNIIFAGHSKKMLASNGE